MEISMRPAAEAKMTFDKEKVEQLRKAYNQAVKDEKEQFQFEGHQFLTKYAKYLLEYLDMRLEK